MQIESTPIAGLMLIKPRIFEDERGYFLETFNELKFNETTGLDIKWQQDNESMSERGVLRGLHFQIPPMAQDKLVRVTSGAVWDVAVDLRKGSSTYGEYFGVELNAKDKIQLFIPKGFAHGFLVLEDNTIFSYKCSEVYNPENERILHWDDPDLKIEWPLKDVQLSDRDSKAPKLSDFDSPFYS